MNRVFIRINRIRDLVRSVECEVTRFRLTLKRVSETPTAKRPYLETVIRVIPTQGCVVGFFVAIGRTSADAAVIVAGSDGFVAKTFG